MQVDGKILTVSLNAALDLTYRVEGFGVGRNHLVKEVARFAGGKANNVARAMRTLGHGVIATGFAGGANGRLIEQMLTAQGATAAFVAIEQESRLCLTVIDPVAGTHTHLREPGPTVTDAELDRFRERFRLLIRQVDFAVISGSLPPGLPDDLYAELVSTAYQVGQVRCVVDAAGTALHRVLPAQPYMVKPNLEELSEWAGRPLTTEAEILEAARDLNNAGPLIVAVSLGAGGLLLVSPEGSWRAVPPAVPVVNAIGSGDSLVAGFVAGLQEGRSAVEIIRMAVACGTANAMTEGVAEFDLATVGQLARRVRVERPS